MKTETGPAAHTPPLGHAALTPIYDAAIALLTRENAWRQALVAEILSGAHHSIIDIGSGTGSLAIALHRASPGTAYVGVDPDPDAVKRARDKAARSGAAVRFAEGFFPAAVPSEPVDVIVSSLVLHQVSLAEKDRILAAAFDRLNPGGRLILADYGLQDSALARLLFRATVQSLDGRADTQPNAEGVLPALIEKAGFGAIEQRARWLTPTGVIYIHVAAKPLASQCNFE